MKLTNIVTMVGVVLIVAYLVHPNSKSKDVVKAFGDASSKNLTALAPGKSFR